MERGPGLSTSMFLTLAAQLTISVSEKLNNIAPHFLCVARRTSEQGLKAWWRRRHKHNDLASLLAVQNSYLTNRHPSSSLEARNGLSNMVCRSVGITLASTNSFTKIKNKGQLSNRSGAQSSIYITQFFIHVIISTNLHLNIVFYIVISRTHHALFSKLKYLYRIFS